HQQDHPLCRRRIVELREERRVGSGDEEIDRRMVEAPQHPFDRRRYRPEIVGKRNGKNRQHGDDIEYGGKIPARPGAGVGQRQQGRAGGNRQHDADRMDYAVRDQFAARIMPASHQGNAVRIPFSDIGHVNGLFLPLHGRQAQLMPERRRENAARGRKSRPRGAYAFSGFVTVFSSARWIGSLPAMMLPSSSMAWPPFMSETKPPASRMSRMPAAMSHGERPRSQKPSKRPAAT